MLGSADLVAFVAVRDLAVARRFYRHCLGLTLVESSDFADAYDVNGTQLRVTRVAGWVAGGHTVVGWRVPDIAAGVAALRAAGVEFRVFAGMDQDADGVWIAPGGARVAWFADPDGNVLSLTQPSRCRVPGAPRGPNVGPVPL